MNRASASKPLSPRAAAFRQKTLTGAKALMQGDLRVSYGVSETAGRIKLQEKMPKICR